MQLAITILIVALAAGYLIRRAYLTRQAAMRGDSPCASCLESKLCSKAGELKKSECGLTSMQTLQKAKE